MNGVAGFENDDRKQDEEKRVRVEVRVLILEPGDKIPNNAIDDSQDNCRYHIMASGEESTVM
jgi:hypothetical protein